jgi:uncharacterized RDD family membrane protein YckC
MGEVGATLAMTGGSDPSVDLPLPGVIVARSAVPTRWTVPDKATKRRHFEEVHVSNPYTAPDYSGGSGAHPDETAPNATLGQRFFGALIDGFVILVGVIPGVILGMLVVGMDDEQLAQAVGQLGGAVGALFVSIGQWYFIATQGQSAGKMAMGTRIVRMDGSPVDFVTGVVMRSWVIGFATGIANLFCMGWLVSIVDAVMIFGPETRCGHDLIAGTKVIQVGY